jgi:hypothetical protein
MGLCTNSSGWPRWVRRRGSLRSGQSTVCTPRPSHAVQRAFAETKRAWTRSRRTSTATCGHEWNRNKHRVSLSRETPKSGKTSLSFRKFVFVKTLRFDEKQSCYINKKTSFYENGPVFETIFKFRREYKVLMRANFVLSYRR